MKDHDSGAREQAEEGGAAGAAGPNVVPFPRSWYGSVDELVPVSPPPPADPEPPVAPADASAFWGGDATSADDDTSDVRAAGAAGAGAFAAQTAHAEPPPPREWQRRPAVQTRPRSWSVLSHEGGGPGARRLPRFPAVVLLTLLAGLFMVFTLGDGGGKPGRALGGAARREPGLTVTQAVPQTATIVDTVTVRTATTSRREAARRRQQVRTGRARVVSSHGRSATGVARGSAPASTSGVTGASAPAGTSGSGDGIQPNASPQSRVPASSDSPSSGSGSSTPRCAPSATNGGACSL